MQHTDFFARIRAIKTEEYKELQAAVELHGGIYEWDLRNPEHPVIAVNLNGIIPAPADVRIYKVYIRKGMLKLCGVEKEYGEEARFQPEEVFAGHLSTIIDYLPPINRTDSIVSTTVHTSNLKNMDIKSLYLMAAIIVTITSTTGIVGNILSGRSRALLPSSPLRTVREGFPSYGSSFSKSLFVCRDRLILLLVSIVFTG